MADFKTFQQTNTSTKLKTSLNGADLSLKNYFQKGNFMSDFKSVKMKLCRV